MYTCERLGVLHLVSPSSLHRVAIPFEFIGDPFVGQEGESASVCVRVLGDLDREVILTLSTFDFLPIPSAIASGKTFR